MKRSSEPSLTIHAPSALKPSHSVQAISPAPSSPPSTTPLSSSTSSLSSISSLSSSPPSSAGPSPAASPASIGRSGDKKISALASIQQQQQQQQQQQRVSPKISSGSSVIVQPTTPKVTPPPPSFAFHTTPPPPSGSSTPQPTRQLTPPPPLNCAPSNSLLLPRSPSPSSPSSRSSSSPPVFTDIESASTTPRQESKLRVQTEEVKPEEPLPKLEEVLQKTENSNSTNSGGSAVAKPEKSENDKPQKSLGDVRLKIRYMVIFFIFYSYHLIVCRQALSFLLVLMTNFLR